MKKSTEIICGCATICFLTAVMVWLFCFSKISNSCTTMNINIIFVTAAPILAYLILIFMTVKGVPVPLFIITTIIFTGAGAYLFIQSVTLEPFSLRTLIIMCIIYCLTFITGAFIAFDPVKESGVITRFDISVFMMIILLVINKWLSFPAFRPAVIMCIIAITVSLIALVSVRSGKYSHNNEAVQGSRHAGRIMMAGIAVILAAFAAAIYFFTVRGLENTSDIIVNVLTWIINILKTVITFIWNCINSFFTWLSTFFKPETMDKIDVSADSFQSTSSADEVIDAQVPTWFYIVIAGIALLAVIFIIIRLRKKKLKKTVLSADKTDNTVLRNNYFRKALLALINKIKAAIIFRVDCIRYKNTLSGLIIFCSDAAPKNIAWNKNESATAFLKRYADYVSGLTDEASCSSDILYQLADLSEQQLYSDHPVTVTADFCSKVRSAVKSRKSS